MLGRAFLCVNLGLSLSFAQQRDTRYAPSKLGRYKIQDIETAVAVWAFTYLVSLYLVSLYLTVKLQFEKLYRSNSLRYLSASSRERKVTTALSGYFPINSNILGLLSTANARMNSRNS